MVAEVDPVTVGAAAAMLVAKMAEKAIEKTANEAVEAAPGALGKVVAWVRRRFAGRAELANVEAAPDSPSRQIALGEIIDAELGNDERAELKALLEEADRLSPPSGLMIATGGSLNIVENRAPITMNYKPGNGGSGRDPS